MLGICGLCAEFTVVLGFELILDRFSEFYLQRLIFEKLKLSHYYEIDRD